MDLQRIQQLNSLSRAAKTGAPRAPVELRPELLWISDDISHLRYSPFWQQLTDQERLTYNQLFAVTTIEQILFFEAELAPLLEELNDVSLTEMEHEALDHFVGEEAEHVEMFS